MRRSKSKSLVATLLFGLIVGAVIFVYTSSTFERDDAVITIDHGEYWNLKQAIKVKITDESGVKSYKVRIKTSSDDTTLLHEQLINPEKSLELNIKPPRSAYALKENSLKLIVEVTDASAWNLMSGNSVIKEFKFIIDKKRPQTSILGNSYKITKGGSALVIFKVVDENLKEIYVESNNGYKFKPQPFYQEGYYISLMAWPIKDASFKASIMAVDYAGNISKTQIPLYLKNKRYKVSKIEISDRFLKGKIADLAEEFVETQGLTDSIEQFKAINEDIREKNENLIHELASKVSNDQIDEFSINKMYPLKNAKVVASFGDHRKYFYKNEKLSESYHLGLDLASNAMATIKPQNGGEVVFADYNGLYGNMPMIHHGLGLYTLYGHCSSVNVNVGEHIDKRTDIANTGKSGYAMGDHLHFGVLVHGIEVRPEEWMDEQWIKLNILDVIRDAKKIINKN